MEKMKLLASGLPVAPIYWNIQSNPNFWNEFTGRTESPSSPHHGLDDVWLRYGKPEHAKSGEAHEAHWYPSAEVFGVKDICHAVVKLVNGEGLGGVLLTRIKPGKMCKPHTDSGWHARRYEKFLVQITSAPGQAFCFEGETHETKPGDLLWFDNSHLHWVINDSEYERVSMIVCVDMGSK